jgi:putative ABC transport system permease protein
MADPNRIYRLLLKLYPARFREEYSEPLERQFRDDYRDLTTSRQRLWLWIRAVADLGYSIPLEMCRELRQDAGYALRVYRRRRLVTLLAVSALALSIGAATGVFSVVNAVLLRSLPFRDPGRLVEIPQVPVNPVRGRQAFLEWRSGARYLDGAAAYHTADVTLSRGGTTVRIPTAAVSANFFDLLGTPPALGRDFRPEEDSEAADGVAILGYGLWQQTFGGDPRVLGSTLRLNGAPVQVVGIAPAGVEYPGGTALWTPTAFDMERVPIFGTFFPQTVARLKSGMTNARARSMLRADAAARGNPWGIDGMDAPNLVPLRDRLARNVKQASLALLAAVALVLLMACANVAHLLLTRTSERREELAMRATLGASRARLVQQLITESVMLTLAAALAGLGVAYWAARLAWATQPAELSTQIYTVLDWRVLGFALALALLTGLLFGVVPASLMGRMQPQPGTVRGRPGGGSGVNRMRALLVAMQAALAVTLLAGCFVMGRTFLRLVGTDLGYATRQAVALTVSVTGTPREEKETTYYREALDSLRAVPGVEAAGATDYLPLTVQNYAGSQMRLDSGQRLPLSMQMAATPGYFDTIGARLVAGRGFTESDSDSSEPVAVVSESLARSVGGINLLGRKLLTERSVPVPKPLTIVGVVRPLRLFGPESVASEEFEVFRPVAQAFPQSVTFVVRVRGNPEPYLSICREAVRRVDTAVPIYSVETLDQKLQRTLARPRFYTSAILFFGAFSLLLAVIAIYGVAAYSIEQRRHEIGVRTALGAEPGYLRLMLLREGVTPVVLGVLAGIAGSLALGPAARHWIRAAEPAGTWMCAGAAGVLATAASLAIWTATRKVMKLDPMTVLRAE